MITAAGSLACGSTIALERRTHHHAACFRKAAASKRGALSVACQASSSQPSPDLDRRSALLGFAAAALVAQTPAPALAQGARHDSWLAPTSAVRTFR